MQNLEKDLLFFYDYLLFLQYTENENTYLNYAGVYKIANYLILKHGLTSSKHPTKFKKNNYIGNYVKLTKMFKLSEFEDSVFALDEIKLVRNQWRLL